MIFTSPPELMTGLTDMLNALFAVLFVIYIRTDMTASGKLWRAIMLSLGISGFMGFVVHSFEWGAGFETVMWKLLPLPMCVCVSLFAVLALVKLRNGKMKSDMLLFSALGAAAYIAMFVFSCFSGRFLLIFTLYAAFCLIFSIFVLAVAAIRDRKYIYLWYIVGLLIEAPGGVIQAMRKMRFTLIWEFDFNSIYHFILLASEILLFIGYISEKYKGVPKNSEIDANNA